MASVWGELKRRNVVKVAVAYAIVAWLLVQVVATVLPLFAAPEWIARVFTFFVVLGFPISLVIAWAYELTPEGIEKTGSVPPSESITRSTGRKLNFVTVGALALALVFVVYNYVLVAPDQEAATAGTTARAIEDALPPESSIAQLGNAPLPVQRFELPLDNTRPLRSTGLSAEIAISPDGEKIAYVARNEDSRQSIYLRSLGGFDSTPIPGTEGARRPAFSSDGKWIVYSGVDIPLLKVAVDGGPPRKIADMDGRNFGNAWHGDSIVVSNSGSQGVLTSYLQWVDADGGDLEDIVPRVNGMAFVWPDILPTGNHALFTTRTLDQDATEGTVSVLDLETLEQKEILKGAYRASYVPTGHIVFGRDDDLWAARFDLEHMDVVGDPKRMVSGVQQNNTFGDLAYDISDTGTLIYIRGESATVLSAPRKLVWAYKNGMMEEITPERGDYYFPRLSPDGLTVAITRVTPDSGRDIWTINLDDGRTRRLTIDDGFEMRPIWSKDGHRIIYSSTANGGGLRIRNVDGTGDAVSINYDGDQRPETVTPDGESLIYRALQGRIFSLEVAPIDGSAEGEILISAPYDVAYSAISPDGNWIAYTSDETGENQVYVQPFPNIDDGKELISINGGEEPRWSADGSELFYRTVNEIWSVPVPPQTGSTFTAGTPELLLTGEFLSHGIRPSFDVSPDGQKFLVLMDPGEEEEQPKSTIAVVTNWFEELERVLP